MVIPSAIAIRPARCKAGTVLALVPVDQARALAGTGFFAAPQTSHLLEGPQVFLPVGSVIGSLAEPSRPMFQVIGRVYAPGFTMPSPLLRSLSDWPDSEHSLRGGNTENFHTLPVSRQGYALACITLSDKGYAGAREDVSGPAMADQAKTVLPLCHEQRFLLPDEPMMLRSMVMELAIGQGYDLILASGGTGLGPRDQTPEALLPILTRRLPGFEQRMMHASLKITPHAAISRAFAGTVGECLILALPGSVKAALENLNAVSPALPHALGKLKGDPADCGRPLEKQPLPDGPL